MKSLNMRYLFLCFLISLTGCNNEPTQNLRIAHVSWPGYEALSLAKNKNLYENVNVVTYRPANLPQTILAFENKVVDVVALTLTHAIELQSKSLEPITIFAVLDVSHGGDVIIANKTIKSINDLAGKRIGITPTAFGAFFLSRAIDTAPGLSLNNMQVVPVTIDDHYNIFINNGIDAVATYEPAKSKILKQKGHIIFDSRQIPNEIIDVLITYSSFAKKNPEALTELLNGYFKALDLLKKQPERSILEMATYEGISPEEYKLSLTGIHIPDREENKAFLTGEDSGVLIAAKKLHKFMTAKNIILKSQKTLPEVSGRFLSSQKVN